MNPKLNTFLTSHYAFLADRVRPHLGHVRDRRPERRPAPAARVFLGDPMDPLRPHPLAADVPRGPHQSSYNKRILAAGPLITAAIQPAAEDTESWEDILPLLDSTPSRAPNPE